MHPSTTAIALALIATANQAGAAQSCESLATLKLPDTTITAAQAVAEGAFRPPPQPAPGPPPSASAFADLPAFCRVAATIKPTTDSDIKIEVWMPASGWNGKFQGVGNAGWSGFISYSPLGSRRPSLSGALARGYAAASTDTGHQGPVDNASFAFGHPEKVIDYGYRAVHEMTVKAKAIIAAFYGDGPKQSYWNGCSSGGRQGLMEAQRFPGDYSGIIAGAPANNWTRLQAGTVWSGQALHQNANSAVSKDQYVLLHKSVLAACDARDGVTDGVLENPASCSFDPSVLQCQGADNSDCLTPAQVEVAREIYAGAVNPRTGQQIFPGLPRGSELGWYAQTPGGRGFFSIAETYFQNVVYQDPKWDFRNLNFDADIARIDKLDNGTLTATNPNLKDFVARGGKLIIYHGWIDAVIAPQNSVEYYKSVLTTTGAAAGKLENSVRLFMVPGMDLCSGGNGPNEFDMLSVLEQWVEQGKAPDRIVASHRTDGKVDRTRPLCPYPQAARYTGSGSTDDAANFVCGSP